MDMLTHINNNTYIINDISQTEASNFTEDYVEAHAYMLFIMSIFNTFILILAVLQLHYYLRISEHFGKLVKLVGNCIIHALPFLIFYFGWILIFSIIFQILGMEIFNDEYIGLPDWVTYFIYTYRNSLGDISVPIYTYWMEKLNTNQNIANSMIGIIWIFWFVN